MCWRSLATVLVMAASANTLAAASQESADEQTLKRYHVGVQSDDLIAYLHAHTLSAAEHRRVLELLGQLGDRRYRVRQRATLQLQSSPPAAPALCSGC